MYRNDVGCVGRFVKALAGLVEKGKIQNLRIVLLPYFARREL